MSELLRGDLSGLPAQGKVVVGFSGGADSTALAHWLLGKVSSRRLVLAHVNHGLRGKESERDEAAARQFAGQFGLRFAVFREDIAARARERGLGVEECGRQVRYAFFHSLASGENDRILTAHHSGDNGETVLLHLCRGTSLAGLCGIPYARGKILRPFLRVSRQEIEAYCHRFRLPYVTDQSNFSQEYARNKIRLQVIPLLQELNPEFLEAISRMTESLSRDRDFLEEEARALLQQAQSSWGLRAEVLLNKHQAVVLEALRLWLCQKGCGSFERKHLDALLRCLSRGGEADLPGGLRACCSQGVLSLEPRKPAQGFSVEVGLGETLLPCGKRLTLKEKWLAGGETGPKIHNLLFKNALDYDIITGNLIARTRREGERFAPAGRKVTKPLKQLFQEQKIPLPQRDRTVLLEWEGRTVFCEGAGPAEGYQITGRTQRALVVTLRETN